VRRDALWLRRTANVNDVLCIRISKRIFGISSCEQVSESNIKLIHEQTAKYEILVYASSTDKSMRVFKEFRSDENELKAANFRN